MKAAVVLMALLVAVACVIVFPFDGITTFIANANSAMFGAHIRHSGGCSGGVSDGTATSPVPDSDCTSAPEPITLFLGGTGLLTLGYAVRKSLLGGRLAG